MRKEDGSNYWQELQSCNSAVNHQESKSCGLRTRTAITYQLRGNMKRTVTRKGTAHIKKPNFQDSEV